MDLLEVVSKAEDAVTVRRVFGEPYEKNGVTVIPVARVQGGGGGGDGTNKEGQGTGGGFGVSARPAGVYVVRGSEVEWKPAVDPNKFAAALQAIAIVALLAVRTIAKMRAKTTLARQRVARERAHHHREGSDR